ncbi:MAG: DUF4433 domain-containing protein [Sphingobacteriales bacterium]|nr:MAG: DUF4433 domain-containing protein [Sphingobacteriales bacterium]
MKIFDWIIGYFNKVRSYFRKNKQEQAVRDPIIETGRTSQEEIPSINEEIVKQEEPLTEVEISKLAEIQTATELQRLIAPPIKIRKRIFDLVEIEQEVTALNKKLIKVQIKQNQIEPVRFPQTYKTEKDIEELERILQKYDNKQNLTLSISAIDKLKSRFGQFDKFLQDRILTKIYRIREEKRRKEEETKKQQVKELIGRIENLINHGNLQEAQDQISKAAISITGLRNPDQKKSFREKLEVLKAEFRDRQIREEAKRQAKELKKQQKEAERKRSAEEDKREEERKRREQVDITRKQQEGDKKKKEEDKKQALQRLLDKKSDWQDFAKVLKNNGITTLYHFTDRVNISSIKETGGLYSWNYLDRENIDVARPGSGAEARWAARQFGLSDFISLSFVSDPPMKHVALKEGRISNPVTLKISTEVCYFIHTNFSTMNAADNRSRKGSTIADLRQCRFDLFNRHYSALQGDEKKYYQAEVLVKTWIPIQFITNINQF